MLSFSGLVSRALVLSFHVGYSRLLISIVSSRLYLLLVYCFTTQLRVDQTTWMAGVPENRVAALFATFRDVAGWFAVRMGRGLEFQCAEVDLVVVL